MSLSVSSSPSAADNLTVWISGSGSGIYRASFDPETGRLGQPELAAAIQAGSWIARHPSKAVLYASYRERGSGGVAAFAIEKEGRLNPLNQVEIPTGSPTHIAVNPSGTLLATSHYGGGASALIALKADGSPEGPALVTAHEISQPGPYPQQDQPRPHFGVFTPDGAHVHQVDLGTDEIWTFAVSEDPPVQTLSHKVGLPAGYGPRHLSFHPSMQYAYVSDELGSKVSVFSYDEETAVLTPIQDLDSYDVSIAEPYNNTSHILVHPFGRFLFIGNRGHDSIGVFAIDPETGELSLVETESARAHWPRNFAIDPSGRWLLVAGARSGTIGVMAIDPETGALTFQLDSVVQVPEPVCLQF